MDDLKFCRVMGDLSLFGTKGHERLAIKDGILCTNRQVNWLMRIVEYFYKPKNERMQTIADFALKFFQENEEEIIDTAVLEKMKPLMSKAEKGDALDQLISKIQGQERNKLSLLKSKFALEALDFSRDVPDGCSDAFLHDISLLQSGNNEYDEASKTAALINSPFLRFQAQSAAGKIDLNNEDKATKDIEDPRELALALKQIADSIGDNARKFEILLKAYELAGDKHQVLGDMILIDEQRTIQIAQDRLDPVASAAMLAEIAGKRNCSEKRSLEILEQARQKMIQIEDKAKKNQLFAFMARAIAKKLPEEADKFCRQIVGDRKLYTNIMLEISDEFHTKEMSRNMMEIRPGEIIRPKVSPVIKDQRTLDELLRFKPFLDGTRIAPLIRAQVELDFYRAFQILREDISMYSPKFVREL